MGEAKQTPQTPVEVMDTTLRDGEQMQDGSYAPEEKLSIARRLLEEVRVDRVEVANARVSRGEEQAVARIMEWASGRGFTERVEVLGFVDRGASVAWLERLGVRVLNVLAKGSRRHVEKQLRKSLEEHLRDIAALVQEAASRGIRCNIYLEDWSGGMLESPEYVREMIAGLQGLGVDRCMLADTRGLLEPRQVSQMVGALVAEFPTVHFDFHAHNDYGLATANSLAAVSAGARGVHCTVNGLGERAGNAPLDEVVVGIHDFLGRRTRVEEKQLQRIAEHVEIFSGRRLACNKPIAGLNVFTQTAGIHADGDRKANLYGSPLSPERFNRRRRYALGKLSGKASLEYNLKELGIDLNPEQVSLVLQRVVSLGDRKEIITSEDLPYIVSDVLETPRERRFALRSCVVVSSMGMKPMATVKLAYRPEGAQEYQEYEESSLGDGGYDALMRAIRAITTRLGLELPALADYQVSIPAGGRTDALVQCTITWKNHGTLVTKGVNSDQVLAAAEATEKMLNLAASPQSPSDPAREQA